MGYFSTELVHLSLMTLLIKTAGEEAFFTKMISGDVHEMVSTAVMHCKQLPYFDFLLSIICFLTSSQFCFFRSCSIVLARFY
jgi:hypothetical protein